MATELSAQNPTMVFSSIAHLINVKLLRECHEKMDGDKAISNNRSLTETDKDKWRERIEEKKYCICS